MNVFYQTASRYFRCTTAYYRGKIQQTQTIFAMKNVRSMLEKGLDEIVRAGRFAFTLVPIRLVPNAQVWIYGPDEEWVEVEPQGFSVVAESALLPNGDYVLNKFMAVANPGTIRQKSLWNKLLKSFVEELTREMLVFTKEVIPIRPPPVVTKPSTVAQVESKVTTKLTPRVDLKGDVKVDPKNASKTSNTNTNRTHGTSHTRPTLRQSLSMQNINKETKKQVQFSSPLITKATLDQARTGDPMIVIDTITPASVSNLTPLNFGMADRIATPSNVNTVNTVNTGGPPTVAQTVSQTGAPTTTSTITSTPTCTPTKTEEIILSDTPSQVVSVPFPLKRDPSNKTPEESMRKKTNAKKPFKQAKKKATLF
jgi:hypothetical protein